MMLVGIALTTIDIFVFSRIANLTVAAIITAVLIIPPFSLPAWGYDKAEGKQKFIITFTISIIFGCIFGLMFGQLAARKLEEDLFSISGIAIFAVGVSVSLSFWTVGHMSREFIRSFADFLAPMPENLGRLISALYFVTIVKEGNIAYRPEQVLARNIMLAILRLDTEEAFLLIDGGARKALLAPERELSLIQQDNIERLLSSSLHELSEMSPRKPTAH